MARSLNLCQFIGNLGQDPETKFLPSGNAVTNFSIGVSDDYKDKQTGQKVDQTEWVRCTAFGKLAEICGEYMRKGSKVYVSGKMKARKWQNKEGVDQWTTEITVNDMQLLDSRSGGSSAPAPSQPSPQSAPRGPAVGNGPDHSDFDDDIPFAPLSSSMAL